MNLHYKKLWWLLALSLLIISCISFMDDISIGGFKLKKAPIKETLTTKYLTEEQKEAEKQERLALAQAKEIVKEEPIDSTPQSFLIFGDSMSENIALRLAAYARQNGHEIHTVNWDSSGTRIWESSDTLDYFIKKYNPTFLFVTLGSNESFARNVDSYRPYVRKILSKIGDRHFVWIGPPSFKEEHGFNDMLLEELPAGTFFRASGLELQRRKDKVHPTVEAAAYEIDSLVRWMRHSAHPILMDLPSDSLSRTRISNTGITYLKAQH